MIRVDQEDESIYLDHAATSPLRPEVLEAMLPFLCQSFGNPSSLHRHGRAARAAVEKAREQVALLVGATPESIVFTSGGTESNNLILRSIGKSERILYSAIEHPSVARTARAMGGKPLAVDAEGRVDLEAFHAASPTLVSVMTANNETGVIQPMEAIAAWCDSHGVPFHTDATQSAGLLPLALDSSPVTYASISAHKMGGPKGAGALYVKRGTALTAQMTGGNQEHRRRAGTENVAAIVGFGQACALALRERGFAAARVTALRDALQEALLSAFPHASVNGRGADRLPQILNMRFGQQEGERVVRLLDAAGVSVSTGSACSSGAVEPSAVLLAMGQSHADALGGVRFSVGWNTTEDTLETALKRIQDALERLSPT